MFSLPLVQRELLIAARRKSGTWLRLGATGISIGLGGLWLLGIAITGGSSSAGLYLFNIYKGLLYLSAMLSGAFLTADSISNERREGTLGLLFLTRVNGWQVAAGKLTAAALSAVFVVLGIAPVLALTLLMGGVTSGDFWRLLLAIGAILATSLSLGLFVSAAQRGSGSGFFITLVTLGAWESVANLAGFLKAKVADATAAGVLDCLSCSPLLTLSSGMDAAYRTRPSDYWQSIGFLTIASLLMTVAAGWIAQRSFQDTLGGSIRTEKAGSTPVERMRFIDGEDPLKVLFAAGKWPVAIAWFPVPITAVVVAIQILKGSGEVLLTTSFYSGALYLFPLGVMAWLRAYRFAELRRTGMLDMILTTPVEDSRPASKGSGIIMSLNAASNHKVLPVIFSIFALQAVGLLGMGLISIQASSGMESYGLALAGIGSLAYQALTIFLRFIAVSSVAVWFALSESRPTMAFVKTAGLALFLPTFAPCFSEMAMSTGLYCWANYKLSRPLRKILASNPVRA